MSKEQPSYYAIITADVRYCKSLKANEKLLYAEITCLTQKEGYCWSGNKYFADLYGVSKDTVSKWITNLVKQGFITRNIKYKDGTKQVEARWLTLCNARPDASKGRGIDPKNGGIDEIVGRGGDEKIGRPIDENVGVNSTSSNTTSSNSLRAKKSGLDLKKFLDKGYDPEALDLLIDHRKGLKKPISTNRIMQGLLDEIQIYATHWKITPEEAFDFYLTKSWISIDPTYQYSKRQLAPHNPTSSLTHKDIGVIIQQEKQRRASGGNSQANAAIQSLTSKVGM